MPKKLTKAQSEVKEKGRGVFRTPPTATAAPQNISGKGGEKGGDAGDSPSPGGANRQTVGGRGRGRGRGLGLNRGALFANTPSPKKTAEVGEGAAEGGAVGATEAEVSGDVGGYAELGAEGGGGYAELGAEGGGGEEKLEYVGKEKLVYDAVLTIRDRLSAVKARLENFEKALDEGAAPSAQPASPSGGAAVLEAPPELREGAAPSAQPASPAASAAVLEAPRISAENAAAMIDAMFSQANVQAPASNIISSPDMIRGSAEQEAAWNAQVGLPPRAPAIWAPGHEIPGVPRALTALPVSSAGQAAILRSQGGAIPPNMPDNIPPSGAGASAGQAALLRARAAAISPNIPANIPSSAAGASAGQAALLRARAAAIRANMPANMPASVQSRAAALRANMPGAGQVMGGLRNVAGGIANAAMAHPYAAGAAAIGAAGAGLYAYNRRNRRGPQRPQAPGVLGGDGVAMGERGHELRGDNANAAAAGERVGIEDAANAAHLELWGTSEAPNVDALGVETVSANYPVIHREATRFLFVHNDFADLDLLYTGGDPKKLSSAGKAKFELHDTSTYLKASQTLMGRFNMAWGISGLAYGSGDALQVFQEYHELAQLVIAYNRYTANSQGTYDQIGTSGSGGTAGGTGGSGGPGASFGNNSRITRRMDMSGGSSVAGLETLGTLSSDKRRLPMSGLENDVERIPAAAEQLGRFSRITRGDEGIAGVPFRKRKVQFGQKMYMNPIIQSRSRVSDVDVLKSVLGVKKVRYL
jgi:hypothetical protein